MAGIECTHGKAVDGVRPDEHDEIGDALEWMRLTYA